MSSRESRLPLIEVTYQQLETGVIPPECKRKVQATGAGGSAEKMSAGQVSISEYAIGHLIISINSSSTCTFKCN